VLLLQNPGGPVVRFVLAVVVRSAGVMQKGYADKASSCCIAWGMRLSALLPGCRLHGAADNHRAALHRLDETNRRSKLKALRMMCALTIGIGAAVRAVTAGGDAGLRCDVLPLLATPQRLRCQQEHVLRRFGSGGMCRSALNAH
jgi:hypothetical protein